MRRDAVDAFNDGRADVLVATDAAGEGLNLHHRCRLVIDVELPWNPLRLEQRVGRVDRLGQRRIVHAIRMFHPDTIEGAVLDHLRIRLQRAEDALDRPISDGDVAAAIFAGAPIESGRPEVPSVAIETAAEEARRLEEQRRLEPSCARNSQHLDTAAQALAIAHRAPSCVVGQSKPAISSASNCSRPGSLFDNIRRITISGDG